MNNVFIVSHPQNLITIAIKFMGYSIGFNIVSAQPIYHVISETNQILFTADSFQACLNYSEENEFSIIT